MRLYGEANDVPGLATGPIETRFARLRENTAAESLIVWTTPGRWAGGEGLSLRFPELHLEFTCTLADGHLIATKVGQVPEDARPPDREAGAVGVVVHPERIPLPPEDVDSSEPDAGVDTLERHFAQLAGRRWGGFAVPLSAALEAEAKEDEARTQRLTVPFKDASMTRGGEEDIWRLKGVTVEALRALDDGEWLEVLDDQGRSRTSGRVIDSHPSTGILVVGVRTASDPPRSGFVRPRSRKKILEQKRALLEELASPTGSLPNLVRLVAAPASMPTPRQERPPHFVNPAILRNRSQARAVGLALGLDEGQALLIQGPPGTGKSTTAAEIDVQLILRDPGVRILVCSHSNHGTDNMLMKVLPFLEDASERIARIGFYERIAKEARPYYAAADADLGEKNIIFTTIDALVLQDIAGARVYDYVILDEANRAGVLDSLLALARGKRMVLVGDPMQLQPVMSEAEQQIVAASNGGGGGGGGRHNGRGRGNRPAPMAGVAQPGANNVIGKSLFAWIQERRFAPASTVLLDQQNRMHPSIGELVSRVFYSNRVRTGPAAPRRGTGLPAFPSPVSWVDTRSLRGNVESRAGGTSLFNVAEARLVTSITRHLASHAPPNLTIGVITAYAEQRDLLRRLMGPHDWPPDRQLEIDTVDAFEGREKDIIVLSLVRANRRRDIGFLRLEQRLNVAVSRSRRLIILVGDTSTLRGGYFNNLVAACQSIGQVIPAPKLIGQFLNRTAPPAGVRRPRHERDERRRDGLPLPAASAAEAVPGEDAFGAADALTGADAVSGADVLSGAEALAAAEDRAADVT
ncbi:MAG TPA: DEAD/DEAH box helicase family protein, partial [Chloroflexota bacterium]